MLSFKQIHVFLNVFKLLHLCFFLFFFQIERRCFFQLNLLIKFLNRISNLLYLKYILAFFFSHKNFIFRILLFHFTVPLNSSSSLIKFNSLSMNSFVVHLKFSHLIFKIFQLLFPFHQHLVYTIKMLFSAYPPIGTVLISFLRAHDVS